VAKLNSAISEVTQWYNTDVCKLADEMESDYIMYCQDYEKATGRKYLSINELIDIDEKDAEFLKIMDIEQDIEKQIKIYETWDYIKFHEYYNLFRAKNYKPYVRQK